MLIGCSSNGGGGTVDASRADVNHQVDQGTVDGQLDGPVVDGRPDVKGDLLTKSDHLKTDLGLPTVCEKKCQDEGKFLCVTKDGKCVECIDDKTCTGNPGAVGSKCNTTQNLCFCANDADCASNLRGKKCNTNIGACGCSVNSDCKAPFSICVDYGWGQIVTPPAPSTRIAISIPR